MTPFSKVFLAAVNAKQEGNYAPYKKRKKKPLVDSYNKRAIGGSRICGVIGKKVGLVITDFLMMDNVNLII